jgi:hypothetical protein
MSVLPVACVAAWLGIMAFFSFGVAPLVFGVMERTAAGHVVRAVLPRYYATGLGLCAIALVVYVAQAVSDRADRWRPLLNVVLCAAMIGLLAWAAAVVTPQADAARRHRDDTGFARAHRSAVTVNGATMATAFALLVIEAFRRTPKGPPTSRRLR